MLHQKKLLRSSGHILFKRSSLKEKSLHVWFLVSRLKLEMQSTHKIRKHAQQPFLKYQFQHWNKRHFFCSLCGDKVCSVFGPRWHLKLWGFNLIWKFWNLIQRFLISGWSRVRGSESSLEIKRERHSIEGDLYWNLQCMRKVSRRGKNCYIHLLGNFLSGHSEDMTVIFPNICYFRERLYYDQRIFKGFECR